MTGTTDHSLQTFLFSGALLFLIGLVQGAIIPLMHNPRMALSAHLTAVQSGMALMIFGLIRPYLQLEQQSLEITRWSSVIGFYLLWAGIALAAATGASRTLPIAGQGFSARKIFEIAVAIIMNTGVVLSFISSLYILVGLYYGLF